MHTQVLVKGAVLLTVWLHTQGVLWCSALPDQLKAAGPPGTHCALFWPPVGTTLTMPTGEVTSILARMRKYVHRLVLRYMSAAWSGVPGRSGERDIGGGRGKAGASAAVQRASDKPGARPWHCDQ